MRSPSLAIEPTNEDGKTIGASVGPLILTKEQAVVSPEASSGAETSEGRTHLCDDHVVFIESVSAPEMTRVYVGQKADSASPAISPWSMFVSMGQKSPPE